MSAVKILVPISGGKDSQACLKLALHHYAPDEVRGLFTHPDDHQAVKDYAAKLARKRAKAVGA
jgi:tRNA(Ile)-lysidine synthase TilS/MesJ